MQELLLTWIDISEVIILSILVFRIAKQPNLSL